MKKNQIVLTMALAFVGSPSLANMRANVAAPATLAPAAPALSPVGDASLAGPDLAPSVQGLPASDVLPAPAAPASEAPALSPVGDASLAGPDPAPSVQSIPAADAANEQVSPDSKVLDAARQVDGVRENLATEGLTRKESEGSGPEISAGARRLYDGGTAKSGRSEPVEFQPARTASAAGLELRGAAAALRERSAIPSPGAALSMALPFAFAGGGALNDIMTAWAWITGGLMFIMAILFILASSNRK